jgi:hypothetical protein
MLPAGISPIAANKSISTSMPRLGFEPSISAFERTNTVLDLDRAATVIGRKLK